ncbi:hypothetical protein CR513_41766, partial [Mucuna pruriens]
MWCHRLKSHLYTKLENVKEDRDNWKKNNALLCTLFWQSIDSFVHNICTNFDTYYELWSQVKSFYTNDIQHLFFIIGMGIYDFVGEWSTTKATFNAFLPKRKIIAEDLA